MKKTSLTIPVALTVCRTPLQRKAKADVSGNGMQSSGFKFGGMAFETLNYKKMKIKQTLMLVFVIGIATSLSAQNADFYKRYAEKGDVKAMYNLAGCYLFGSGGVNQDLWLHTYWLKKAANANYVPAQRMLARCYLEGIGVQKDYGQAWQLALSAAKQNDAYAYYLIALMYREGFYVNKSWTDWFHWLRGAAQLGDDDAQKDLGIAYLFGVEEADIRTDADNAVSWLAKSAGQNNAEALFYLGLCYEEGLGVNQNLQTSVQKYSTSADLGYGPAQCVMAEVYLEGRGNVAPDPSKAIALLNLANAKEIPKSYKLTGDVYYYGKGTEINYEKAAGWYKKAVDAGETSALIKMCNLYLFGQGVPKDNSKAFEYARRSADASCSEGYFTLGMFYEGGIGTTENLSLAASNYQKAAESGNDYAKVRLYEFYKEGMGVTKDTQTAIQYLREAADAGLNEAMFSLGMEYGLGIILHQENSKAIEWLTKAADNGFMPTVGLLGASYYHGDFITPKDYNKAFEYLKQAAQNVSTIDEQNYGNLFAEVYRDLGACYRFGRGTEVDNGLAAYYTGKAAELGDTDSSDALNWLQNPKIQDPSMP